MCAFIKYDSLNNLFFLLGMPMYKNPFEKGQLIIQFFVDFPNCIPPEVIPALENCLPPRPRVSKTINFTMKNSIKTFTKIFN